MNVTIISGCPGSGKTELSRRLAARSERGVHLATDGFYHFLSHRIDPSTPESAAQNAAVVRAFLASAKSFASDGYDVFVDGVIGPWWRPQVLGALGVLDYVLLTADLDTVVHRTRQRAVHDQASASPQLVRRMHQQFSALTDLGERTIDTTAKSLDAVVREFDHRAATGAFRYA